MKKIVQLASLFLFLISNSYVDKKELDKKYLNSGINLTCSEKVPFEDKEKKAINRLLEIGFSSIFVNPSYYQDSLNSNEINQNSRFDKKHLDDLIDYANDNHIRIWIKPLINTSDGFPRTKILPEDIEKWTNNYDNIILELTKTAINKSVEGLIIGCEIDNILENYPFVFNNLISKIRRSGYEGKLGYSIGFSSLKDTEKIEILNELPLDFIGLDFYVSMHNNDKYEVKNYFERIKNVSNKPLIITEFGYRSVEKGNKWPMFNYKLNGKKDEDVQNQSIKNFYDALLITNNIEGVIIWVTDNSLYYKDVLEKNAQLGYSPFNKKAQKNLIEFNQKRYNKVK